MMNDSRDPRERPMSIDRTKRCLHQDSEDEDARPPTKLHASEPTTSDPMPSTSSHPDQDDGFRYQGREYARARKDRYEQSKNSTAQPKEAPTSQPQPSTVPKILIPATEGFQSPVDVAEALEEELNLNGKLPMKFLYSGQVLISPPTMELHDTILNLEVLKGKAIQLQAISHSTTKGVLLRYPLLMPLSPIQKNPAVISAERLTTRDGENTRQVLITVRGPLPGSLDLGSWGTFYTRPYSREPLRCFNCQKFGHHKTNCTLPPKCGVCAGRHDTERCIKTHKDGGATTAKCPNCNQQHHAWNKKCSARREIVDTQRATQHQWMVRHRPTLANTPVWQGRSALAATSTWGNKTSQPAAPNQSSQQHQPLTADQFPALGAAASQPRTSSRPRQRISGVPAPAHRPTPPTRQHNIAPTPAQPSTPTPQADHITLSKADLQDMFQTFATALVSMLGMKVPEAAINTLTETVVSKVSTQPASQKPLAGPSQTSSQPRSASPPPSPVPHSPSPSSSPVPPPQPGMTPASANIEREKAALGLTRTTQKHQTDANQPQTMDTTPTQTMPPPLTPTTSKQTTQDTQSARDPTKKKCKHHKKEKKRSRSCSGIAAPSGTRCTF